jgi:hypothetical protein
MPTSTNEPDNSSQRRPSRLEAEVEEILSRAQAEEPLPPPTPFRKPRRARGSSVGKRLRQPGVGSSVERWLTAAPLFTALALAIIAYVIRDVSPLLTRLVVIGAMVALFWPFFGRWHRPTPPSTQMWRGRTIDLDRSGPSPLDEIRRWFRNRR